MAANEKLPKELQEETKQYEETFKAEQKAAKENEGLLVERLSDIVVLTDLDGNDYECVAEAAPVWLARGYKVKKNGN